MVRRGAERGGEEQEHRQQADAGAPDLQEDQRVDDAARGAELGERDAEGDDRERAQLVEQLEPAYQTVAGGLAVESPDRFGGGHNHAGILAVVCRYVNSAPYRNARMLTVSSIAPRASIAKRKTAPPGTMMSARLPASWATLLTLLVP